MHQTLLNDRRTPHLETGWPGEQIGGGVILAEPSCAGRGAHKNDCNLNLLPTLFGAEPLHLGALGSPCFQLRKIQRCKASVQLNRLRVPRQSSLLFRFVIAAPVAFSVFENQRQPRPRRSLNVLNPSVLAVPRSFHVCICVILALAAEAKIFAAIIQAVFIYVINLHPFWRIQNHPMKVYGCALAVFARLPLRITCGSRKEPTPLGKPIKVLPINNRKLIVAKDYACEIFQCSRSSFLLGMRRHLKPIICGYRALCNFNDFLKGVRLRNAPPLISVDGHPTTNTQSLSYLFHREVICFAPLS